MSDHLSNTETVLFQLYGTEVSVYELALNFATPSCTSETLQQLDSLQKCLYALNSWFQTWERMETTRWLGLTFGIFTQKIQSLGAVFRLSTANNISGWNTVEARKTIDVLDLLERMAMQMDTAAAALLVAEDDPSEDSSEYLWIPLCCLYLDTCNVCTESRLFWLTCAITVWRKAASLMRRIKAGFSEELKVRSSKISSAVHCHPSRVQKTSRTGFALLYPPLRCLNLLCAFGSK